MPKGKERSGQCGGRRVLGDSWSKDRGESCFRYSLNSTVEGDFSKKIFLINLNLSVDNQ
jgi:hypothetical protein